MYWECNKKLISGGKTIYISENVKLETTKNFVKRSLNKFREKVKKIQIEN